VIKTGEKAGKVSTRKIHKQKAPGGDEQKIGNAKKENKNGRNYKGGRTRKRGRSGTKLQEENKLYKGKTSNSFPYAMTGPDEGHHNKQVAKKNLKEKNTAGGENHN